MVYIRQQVLNVLEITLLLMTMYTPSWEQDNAVDFSCKYSNCKCRQLSWEPDNFIMECTTSPLNAVIQPRNQSINIVALSIQCIENTNLLSILRIITYDMTLVQSLTLVDCKTSLHDIITIGNFKHLKNLTLRGAFASLSDTSRLTKGLAGLVELTSLNISDSSLNGTPSICSQSELVFLNMSGNLLHSTGGPYQNCKEIKHTKLRVLDLSRNRLTELESWIHRSTISLIHLYLSFNQLDEDCFTGLADLSRIRSLDISNNLITVLSNSSFRNNVNLRKLNISRNSILILENGAFTELIHLEYLDMSRNAISHIDDGAFSNMHHLKLLDLSFNSLQSLPLNVFAELIYLQRLLITNNNLMDLPAFTQLGSLLALNLRNNKIVKLHRNTFSSLTKLQAVSLSGNSLNTMDFQTFEFSSSLMIVDLSYNNISSLVDGMDTKRVLSKLAAVSYLRLDYNRIVDISVIGTHFLSLNYLFLDNNQIRTIYKNSLPDSLKIISLSDNKISRIEANAFRNMQHLELVTLQRNYPYMTRLNRWSIGIRDNVEPKPKFYIGGNLFICDCKLAYLKAWDTDRNNIAALRNYHPTFSDLQDVYCITLYDTNATSFRDVPMSHFVCEYESGRHCSFGCKCCLKSNCSCDYICPMHCSCYYGGSLWTSDMYERIHCDNASLTVVPQNIPADATHLYLSGNEIPSLTSDTFLYLKEVQYLYLNNSGIAHIDAATFQGMNKLRFLFLDHNSISELLKESFYGLRTLTELHLDNNRISYIEEGTFSMFIHLGYLSLENNLLNTLHAGVLNSLERPQNILLLGNPWSCDCQSMAILKEFMNVYGSSVERADEMRCSWSSNNTPEKNSEEYVKTYNEKINMNNNHDTSISVLQYEYDIICSDNRTTANVSIARFVFFDDGRHVAALAILIVIIVILLTVLALAFWKRRELQAWIFIQFGWRILNKNKNINEAGRKYDAFVSYSSKDEHMVVHELAPRLEGGDNPYTLCLHYRDFPVGDCIADTIIDSIEASKRTLMLISENFLSSEWCRYEFQTAHHHILKENTHRLIMVLLQDLELEHVDPDLRVHLKTGNFLRYDDPWFWEKLYFVLPDRNAPVVHRNIAVVYDEDDDDVFFTDAQLNDINDMAVKGTLQGEHSV